MTCLRTYATLCVYSSDLTPGQLSERLGIEPTRSFEKDLSSKYRGRREHNFWAWSTQGLLDSTENLDHLNLIFTQIQGKESLLSGLRSEGVDTTISVYWDSDGQGGPELKVEIISELHRFGLNIWWDIYFVEQDAAGA